MWEKDVYQFACCVYVGRCLYAFGFMYCSWYDGIFEERFLRDNFVISHRLEISLSRSKNRLPLNQKKTLKPKQWNYRKSSSVSEINRIPQHHPNPYTVRLSLRNTRARAIPVSFLPSLALLFWTKQPHTSMWAMQKEGKREKLNKTLVDHMYGAGDVVWESFVGFRASKARHTHARACSPTSASQPAHTRKDTAPKRAKRKLDKTV